MRFLFVFLISALIFIGNPWQADAGITVSEKNRYFNVTGKTGKQIYREIRRRAPPELRRKHWIAATYAKYNFKKVKFGIKGKKCVATKINIHLSLTYHYPKWKNQKGSSRSLRKRWREFEKGLVLHEKTHGRIFRDMMKEIEGVIRSAKGTTKRQCDRLIKNVDRKIAAIEKRYNRKQNAFDRKENRSNSTISKIEKAFIKSK